MVCFCVGFGVKCVVLCVVLATGWSRVDVVGELVPKERYLDVYPNGGVGRMALPQKR